MGFPV
ncbi:unnamed protein product, partial [Rotaria sp. Silwood1]